MTRSIGGSNCWTNRPYDDTSTAIGNGVGIEGLLSAVWRWLPRIAITVPPLDCSLCKLAG